MAKNNNVSMNDLVALLGSMSEADRNALGLALKENDTPITARKEKASKVYVAKRINLVDSKPNAKKTRVKGSVEYLTEKQVFNTLNTWIRRSRGVNEEQRVATVNSNLKGIVEGIKGVKTVFSIASFKLEGIEHTSDLTDLPTTMELE